MRLKIDEKHLEHLESIHDNENLRAELERVIETAAKIFREIEPDAGPYRAITDAKTFISKTTSKLSWETGIDAEALRLYISLDSQTCSIIRNQVGEQIGLPVIFENKENPQKGKIALDGGKFERAYGEEIMELINFCDDSLHLLPDSSQRKVRELQEEYNLKPKVSKIFNEFERKVYAASLSKGFDPKEVMAHFNFFGWIRDTSERVNTYYHFHKALQEKYIGEDSEKIQYAQDKTINKLSKMLGNADVPWTKFYRDTFAEIFKKDETFLLEFSNLALEDKTRAIFEKVLRDYEIEMPKENRV